MIFVTKWNQINEVNQICKYGKTDNTDWSVDFNIGTCKKTSREFNGQNQIGDETKQNEHDILENRKYVKIHEIRNKSIQTKYLNWSLFPRNDANGEYQRNEEETVKCHCTIEYGMPIFQHKHCLEKKWVNVNMISWFLPTMRIFRQNVNIRCKTSLKILSDSRPRVRPTWTKMKCFFFCDDE